MPFTTMVTYYIKNPDFWFHWLDSILSSKFSNNVCFFCRLNYTKIHISVYLYIYIYRLTKPSKFIIKGSFIERRYEPKKKIKKEKDKEVMKYEASLLQIQYTIKFHMCQSSFRFSCKSFQLLHLFHLLYQISMLVLFWENS